MLKITGKETLPDILTQELCDYLIQKIFYTKSMNCLLCNSLLVTETCLNKDSHLPLNINFKHIFEEHCVIKSSKKFVTSGDFLWQDCKIGS